jgi:hypothetical protein
MRMAIFIEDPITAAWSTSRLNLKSDCFTGSSGRGIKARATHKWSVNV